MKITDKIHPTAPLHSTGTYYFGADYKMYIGILSTYDQHIPGIEHIILMDTRDPHGDEYLSLYFDPSLNNIDYFQQPKLNKLYKYIGLDYDLVINGGGPPYIIIGSSGDYSNVVDRLHDVIEFDIENANEGNFEEIEDQIGDIIDRNIVTFIAENNRIIFETFDDITKYPLSSKGVESLKSIRNAIRVARAMSESRFNPSKDSDVLDTLDVYGFGDCSDGDAIAAYDTDTDMVIDRLTQPDQDLI